PISITKSLATVKASHFRVEFKKLFHVSEKLLNYSHNFDITTIILKGFTSQTALRNYRQIA
ncbi:MAG: hypothetical protein ACFFDT_12200, partial [Candidatus Hodarchaeota archaeon]